MASNSSSLDASVLASETIMFGVYTALIPPSTACSLYLLVQFARKQALRSSIYNHIIIVLLIHTFLQVSSDVCSIHS